MVRIFITGAAGFLASHLIKDLLDKKYEVIGLVRAGKNLKNIHGLDVKIVVGSLDDIYSYSEFIESGDIVIHTYSLSPGANASLEEYKNKNIEYTKKLINVCAKKNIKQLVYISSASVIGPNVTKLITEETIPEPDNHYGATKLKAEELVQNFSNRHKVPTLILRLPTLYGPNMNLAGASLKLFKLSKKPIFLLVGNGNNPYEFSYIKNISHGIVQAIEANFSGCNLYNIAENNKSSLRKIITVMSENFENKISFISLPQSLLLRLGKLGDMFSRFSGKQFPLRSRVVRGLLGGWVTDTSKAKKDFNLDQPYTLEQGIHETSDWLESVNYFE